MFGVERNPYFMFHFSDPRGQIRPRVFTDPKTVLIAHSLAEVRQALEQVDSWVKKGYYAAGYLSYEAAPAFDPAYDVTDDSKIPLLFFAIFERETNALCHADSARYECSPWRADTLPEVYDAHLARIKHAIAQGDTYQVNYTMRLRAQFAGDDLAYYHALREAQQANYCAYLNIGRFRILSASPELFFRLEGKRVITRPMKGTVRRGRWLQEDEQLAAWLHASEKNRVENVMIVDLLRNDLSKIPGACEVSVPSLFALERYPTVHQMTSTVSAKIGEHATFVDVLAALFPCGSITGAPKISTMRLIAELESQPREIYCGAIGLIEPGGDATFNVAIRTLLLDRETGEALYGVGGGITWNSEPRDEYAEALTKAALLDVHSGAFELLETMRLECGAYMLLERHLKRLSESAKYFGMAVDLLEVRRRLAEHALLHGDERRRVRLLVSKDGDQRIESTPFHALQIGPLQVAVAKVPILSSLRFLYHKTTQRTVYETQQKDNPGCFDVLLWNERGELTEFTNGNLVLEMDGRLVTPARDSGLLAGTFRALLLDAGILEEKVLTIADVHRASQVWWINSVRGWVSVHVE
ncbi:aminodeoxychorismate synthase component I [Ferroacidibacillus organovorans]|uniref:Aminodeoxychorismate synthase, component I n=1 Tax=Ferroacidibacillus organovorans TaxID=1765683 RepID=A0A1V4EVP1_9BACL|nr:aminodeoxychorismate synthase component I [Ferroacidibacillus organovorans]OPG16989.1 aminodeoxychorismate synthase, component I [Ferroacidibacillus organovorans]